jgi:hypothetical protein
MLGREDEEYEGYSAWCIGGIVDYEEETEEQEECNNEEE